MAARKSKKISKEKEDILIIDEPDLTGISPIELNEEEIEEKVQEELEPVEKIEPVIIEEKTNNKKLKGQTLNDFLF